MKIQVKEFHGMRPKLGNSKLGGSEAQTAIDCKLWSKDLRAYTKPTDVTSPTKTGTKRSFYKLGSYWLHWTTYVKVIESPVSSDAYGRIYYTGDKVPKLTTETLASTGGTDYPEISYQLGVPAPVSAASLVVTGGSSGSEIRSYFYTYVTQWGEEGSPGPAVTAEGFANATSWDLSSIDVAPLNTGTITNAVHSGGVVTITCSANHLLRTGEYVDIASVVGMTSLNATNWKVTRLSATTFSVILTPVFIYSSGGTWTRETDINTTSMVKRIYRTVAGVYKYVAEIAIATTTYVDSLADTSLGDTITSTNYDMPPSEMDGIISMPNGIVAGFVNNEICFSEPYLPHAWPESYRINTDNDIVAMATWGFSIIIGTEKYPYRVTGVHPSAMSKTRIEREQACSFAPSMVALKEGVAYASPDGIMYISAQGAQLITINFLKKDEWKLYAPASLRAAVYDNRYYAWYENGGADSDESGGFVFDPEETNAEFSKLSSQAQCVWVDRLTDTMYIMQAGVIQQWEGGSTQYTNEWRSKEFIPRKHVVMRAAQMHVEPVGGVAQADWLASLASNTATIDAGYTNNTLYYRGAYGGAYYGKYVYGGGPYYDIVISLGTPAFVTFELYQDGVLIHSESVDADKDFRITEAGRGHAWEIRLTSAQIIVKDFAIAPTFSELTR